MVHRELVRFNYLTCGFGFVDGRPVFSGTKLVTIGFFVGFGFGRDDVGLSHGDGFGFVIKFG